MLPVDLDHEPTDLAEAKEMLLRVQVRRARAERVVEAAKDLIDVQDHMFCDEACRHHTDYEIYRKALADYEAGR